MGLMSPITYASMNFAVAELEPNPEDADLADDELSSDDAPDEEESDAAALPESPAEG